MNNHGAGDLRRHRAHYDVTVMTNPDQLDPWLKDQLGNALLSTILPQSYEIFVSYGRACPSHMTQYLVTIWAKTLTGE